MKRKPLFQRQNLLLQLSSKRKQSFLNENSKTDKEKKSIADVMRQLNGLLDFETGEEVLADFQKHQGEEIYIK